MTRHIAVTASAAATLQAESDGRATLGFAQGDSALSQIGQRRLSVAAFERSLEDLQTLLRGEDVRLPNGAPCRVRWLYGSNLPKVPVQVAATGRRRIAAAARHAEAVDLTLGAELERLRWGVATARQAGSDALTVGAISTWRSIQTVTVPGSPSSWMTSSSTGSPSPDPQTRYVIASRRFELAALSG